MQINVNVAKAKSPMIPNTSDCEAVFNGEAATRIKRTDSSIIHRGYQLPSCRSAFVFPITGTSPGTFFLILQYHLEFVLAVLLSYQIN